LTHLPGFLAFPENYIGIIALPASQLHLTTIEHMWNAQLDPEMQVVPVGQMFASSGL
jgi:hypothetical protein